MIKKILELQSVWSDRNQDSQFSIPTHIKLKQMKKYIILLLTAFIFLCLFQESCVKARNDENDTTKNLDKTLALKDYQQDFNKMVELVLKKHPQPYAFISEDSFKSLINIQYNKITDTTTIGGFLWICKSVVAAINCGHTDMWFSTEFGVIPNALLFPMNVKYVGSRLYVIDAKNNFDKLAAGTEILTINGLGVEKMQKEIFQHLSSDGFNESMKHESTNIVFSWYCSLLFNIPASYTVTVKQNGNIEEIKLKQAENMQFAKTYLDDCENQLCFDTDLENNTAIITIRHFVYDKERFKSFIDDCFLQINENEIQNLIIDLRKNGGGEPVCGSYLLQYIANKPYTYFHEDVKGYRKLKKTIQPNPNAFKNKPYILTNGLCTSTTGHFCSLVKENNLGIFIGDETGATYTCNAYDKFIILENTKLLLRVARQICKTPASTLTNKHGIIPDHYVIPNIDNILNNTDTVLNYTLRLIEKEQLVLQQ